MSQGRLQQAIDHYRAQLLAREVMAERALTEAYRGTLKAIQPRLDKLYKQVADKQANGETIPLSWLHEEKRLETIKLFVSQQIDHYAALARMQTGQLQHYGVTLGTQSAQAMLNATVPSGINWTFDIPSPHAIADLVGATQSGTPLSDLFNGFGAEAAKNVSQALINGITLGDNPRTIARDVQNALNISRARALTISTNEMLRCYKSANTATYRTNADVVDKWRWTCDKSARTCFPAGTLVQTRRGNVPIEQVKIGDEVLTHKGRYKRVYDTLQRPYLGEMVTIVSGNKSIVATSNHPFLIEREGKLNWIEAGDIRLTDHVVCKSDSSSQIVNHNLGNVAIKRRVGNTNNAVPSALQKGCFSGILLLNPLGTMPVDTIDFKSNIAIWQEEVNGISPTLYNMFLKIFDSQGFQADAGVSFWRCLSCVFTVALNRAKASTYGFGWGRSELLTAIRAGIDNWWSATFFRTIFDIGAFLTENLSTSIARYIDCLEELTSSGTIERILSTENDNKFLFTNNTRFCCMMMKVITFSCAVFSWTFRGRTERFATSLAYQIKRRGSNVARTCVWLSVLPNVSAIIRTKTPTSFALPSLGYGELLTAYFTDQFDFSGSILLPISLTTFRFAKYPIIRSVTNVGPSFTSTVRASALNSSSVSFDINFFHKSIISQHYIHVHSDTTVYNVEVEEDHSYVANDFVVHNCAACIAMDGTIHDLSEDLESHVKCRCVPTPLTKSWDDILSSAGIDSSGIADTRPNIQSGPDWFDEQHEAIQRAILGNAKYDAWSNGDFTLSDVVGRSHDNNWGSSIYVKPLKDLVK